MDQVTHGGKQKSEQVVRSSYLSHHQEEATNVGARDLAPAPVVAVQTLRNEPQVEAIAVREEKDGTTERP